MSSPTAARRRRLVGPSILCLCLAAAAGGQAAAAEAVSWSAPVAVPLEGDLRVADLSAALSPDGSALLAWRSGATGERGSAMSAEDDLPVATVKLAERTTGRRFGRPRALSVGGHRTGPPKVEMDGGGNAIVSWLDRDRQGAVRLLGVRRLARAGIEPPTSLVELGTRSGTEDPARPRPLPRVSLAVGPSGAAALAWLQPGTSRVMLATGTVRGGFAAPELVTDAAPGGVGKVHVDVGPAGDVVIGWIVYRESTEAVQVAVRPPGGGVSAPQTVHSITSRGAPRATLDRLLLSAGADGIADIVWTTVCTGDLYCGTSPDQLYAATRTATGQVSAPEYSALVNDGVSLARTPGGGSRLLRGYFTQERQELDGASSVLQASRPLGGTRLGASKRVEPGSGPSLAPDARGAAAAWLSSRPDSEAWWEKSRRGAVRVRAAVEGPNGYCAQTVSARAPVGRPQIVANAAGAAMVMWGERRRLWMVDGTTGRATPKIARLRRPHPTRGFRITLSEAATTTLTLERRRRRGYRRIARERVPLAGGVHNVPLRDAFTRKRLPSGRYRIIAQATDCDRHASRAARITFTTRPGRSAR